MSLDHDPLAQSIGSTIDVVLLKNVVHDSVSSSYGGY